MKYITAIILFSLSFIVSAAVNIPPDVTHFNTIAATAYSTSGAPVTYSNSFTVPSANYTITARDNPLNNYYGSSWEYNSTIQSCSLQDLQTLATYNVPKINADLARLTMALPAGSYKLQCSLLVFGHIGINSFPPYVVKSYNSMKFTTVP